MEGRSRSRGPSDDLAAMSRVAEFVEIVSEQLGDAALAFLKPEIDRLREKEQARKIQRRGTRKPTGKPRGRPRLTPEKAAESRSGVAHTCESLCVERGQSVSKIMRGAESLWHVSKESQTEKDRVRTCSRTRPDREGRHVQLFRSTAPSGAFDLARPWRRTPHPLSL